MKNARRPVHRGDIREEESFEKNVQQGANDTDAYADADKINEAESAPFYEEDTKEPEYVSETSAYASETPEEMERHYEERLAERRAERRGGIACGCGVPGGTASLPFWCFLQ